MVTPESWPHLFSPNEGARHIVSVLQSQSVGASFHRLRLACSPIAHAARPGQFVHVLPGALLSADAEDIPTVAYGPLLRRAFSIMTTSNVATSALHVQASQNARSEEKVSETESRASGASGAEEEPWFEILFRVGGQGTQMLARSRVGDLLDVLGPLGNGFNIKTTETGGRAGEVQSAGETGATERPVLLVGGGIGVPPLIFAAQEQCNRGVSHETGSAPKSEVEAFVGARTAGDLVGVEELRQAGARVHICTDDGSQGERALVTQPLRQRLLEMVSVAAPSPVESAQTTPGRNVRTNPLVCACGPWPMLRAVAALCAEMDIECRVSLEESMPCGVGVCNGCVVPMLDAPDDYGKFQRICVHGPVLEARAVDWSIGSASHPGATPRPQDITPVTEQEGASQ